MLEHPSPLSPTKKRKAVLRWDDVCRIFAYTNKVIYPWYAQVGKGLLKDDKAQKLALQHWLEAVSLYSFKNSCSLPPLKRNDHIVKKEKIIVVFSQIYR